MNEVGIRALRQNASEIVSRAAAGEVIVITDRGRPVAQMSALPKSRLQELRDAGLLRPATAKLSELPPPVRIEGLSLSDELIKMREEERY